MSSPETDKAILNKLTQIQVSISRLETQSELVLSRLDDHEQRLRSLEARKGFWSVLSGILAALTAYLLTKAKF